MTDESLRRPHRRIAWTALLGLLVGGCAGALETPNEHMLGRSLSPALEHSRQGIIDDPTLRSYVSRVGSRVTSTLPWRGILWQFEMLADEDPALLVLPGGAVYVTRGLLLKLEQERHLTSVFALAIAHTLERTWLPPWQAKFGSEWASVLRKAGTGEPMDKWTADERAAAAALVQRAGGPWTGEQSYAVRVKAAEILREADQELRLPSAVATLLLGTSVEGVVDRAPAPKADAYRQTVLRFFGADRE